MKNTFKLLALSTATILSIIAFGNTNANNTKEEYSVSTKIKNYEGTRILNAIKNETTIDFFEGSGSDYMSNVKVQYATGDKENTSALRFVSAVKGTINSYDNIELPGQYGFHISYKKVVNDSIVVADYMYDVEYIYHSIGETIDDTTIYYTNDYSTYSANTNRKSIQEWTGDSNDEYNLFIAIELNNIPEINLNSVVTIQPYLKLSTGDVLLSSNYRYSTVNNAKDVVSGYYLQVNDSISSMSLNDNSYELDLTLLKGDTVNLLNQYGEIIDSYTSIYAANYIAKYDTENFGLVAKLGDTLIEAESGVYDGTNAKTFSTSAASGGMGACDFNDCGQGISLMYYSYIAGTYDVEIAYWTGVINSKSNVYVNGNLQTTATYTEMLGWAPEGVSPSKTTISLTFSEGWNTISLSKAGTSTDDPQYGGYVMLDYLKVLGTEQEFDPTSFDTSKPTFRIEAEHGLFNTGELPKNDANNESGEYYIGSMDDSTAGDNVTFNFKAPLNGQYDLQIGYAKGGNAPKADITVNNTFIETVSFDNYENEAWNNFNLNSHKTRITLSSDEFNSVKVAINESWFCFDYIVLTYVGE